MEMEWGDFLNMLQDFSEQANREQVTITFTVYPDHTELSVEPFQPMSKIINEGSKLYYEFKGGPDE